MLCLTNGEVDLDGEGHIRVKCGMTGQYMVEDLQMLELTADAYCPGRVVTLETGFLELPAILESRRETIYGEQAIPAEAGTVADLDFLSDFPRQQRAGEGISLELPGMVQMVYYAEDGSLQSASLRWNGQQTIPADWNCAIAALPLGAQAELPSGSRNLRLEVPVQMTVTGNRGLPMITGMELGEPVSKDGPSLILRRAGETGLWDMAKASGSTMEAIRKANSLEAEPAPGQMLLIPVRG